MKILYRIGRWGAKWLFRIFYTTKVYGLENIPAGPCILAPNHASFLDPPLVGVSCNDEVAFLAKGYLFTTPPLTYLLPHLNSYPVQGNAQDTSSIKLIIQLLNDKKKVVIFPEGKRTSDGKFHSIKRGIGMLVSICECPVVPVYIAGTYDIWPRSRHFPKLHGEITCVFGKPISWDAYKNLPKKQGQEEISKQLKNSLEKLQEWFLNGAIGSPP